MIENKKRKWGRILLVSGILIATWAVSYLVATWFWAPAGERWIASGGAERFETRSGILFLDKRITPIVKTHYVRLTEDWGSLITDELQLAPKDLPTIYFFLDRATFERYAKQRDPTARAFYRGRAHAIYTYGQFARGQLSILDEEGVLVHELTHALVQSSIGKIPIWLDEGLAHLMEQGARHDGKWYAGLPSVDHINAVFDALERDELPSLTRLFELGLRKYNRMGHLPRGMSHFLMMFLDEGGHLKDFLGRISSSEGGRSPEEISRILCETAGIQPANLQDAFVQFLRDKEDLKAYGNGARLEAAGAHEAAIAFYRDAIEIDSTRGPYWDRLGTCLYLAPEGRSEEEGESSFQRAAEAEPFPGQLTTLTIVANHMFDGGQHAEARQAYEKLLERRLPTPTILHKLASTYIDEDPEEALRLVDEALKLPRDGAFFRGRFEKLEQLRQELAVKVGVEE